MPLASLADIVRRIRQIESAQRRLMPTRLSHSWMNFEHGFENQPGYLFRSPGANRIHAVRLSDQIDMDGLRVKNRRSSLGVRFVSI